MKSRHASAASTSPSAVAAASRAPYTASPGRNSVLDGMRAQYEHSPPTSSRSTTATRRPPLASAAAQCSPGAATEDDEVIVAAHAGATHLDLRKSVAGITVALRAPGWAR